MARRRLLDRAARRIALPLVVLLLPVVAGCGATRTVAVPSAATTTSPLSSASLPGGGGPTTSPVHLPLPFDMRRTPSWGIQIRSTTA